MAGILEVRWHGRGGQGTVTAAKVLAEAAMAEGKNVQAFPEYGPERMGAPLRAYNRVSEMPMTIHCQVTNPAVVAVVDPTLLDTVDVTEGTTAGRRIHHKHTPDAWRVAREAEALRYAENLLRGRERDKHRYNRSHHAEHADARRGGEGYRSDKAGDSVRGHPGELREEVLREDYPEQPGRREQGL